MKQKPKETVLSIGKQGSENQKPNFRNGAAIRDHPTEAGHQESGKSMESS
jgi:hypothetical protein